MNTLAQKKLLTSAKDISNPGCLGTLGMLLETSCKGAFVELGKIPTPEEVDLIQWLKAYQGCGFVATCKPENTKEVLTEFGSVGLTSCVVGGITDGRKLVISDAGKSQILFDFESDIITGCSP